MINYSKGYTRAGILRQAGERLRAECPDVVDELEIGGITAFGANAMTVRTSACVKPGRHDTVAAQLRLLINDMFGRYAAGASRKTLVPGTMSLELAPQPIVTSGAKESAIS